MAIEYIPAAVAVYLMSKKLFADCNVVVPLKGLLDNETLSGTSDVVKIQVEVNAHSGEV